MCEIVSAIVSVVASQYFNVCALGSYRIETDGVLDVCTADGRTCEIVSTIASAIVSVFASQ